MPVFALVLYLGITVVERHPKIWNTGTWNTGAQIPAQNQERVYRTLLALVVTEKVLMIVNFTFITLWSSLTRALPGWYTDVFLAAVLGTLIFFLVRLFRLR